MTVLSNICRIHLALLYLAKVFMIKAPFGIFSWVSTFLLINPSLEFIVEKVNVAYASTSVTSITTTSKKDMENEREPLKGSTWAISFTTNLYARLRYTKADCNCFWGYEEFHGISGWGKFWISTLKAFCIRGSYGTWAKPLLSSLSPLCLTTNFIRMIDPQLSLAMFSYGPDIGLSHVLLGQVMIHPKA